MTKHAVPGIACLAAAGMFAGLAAAATGPILKKEPPEGELAAGARVLVDDGSCPRGQIKEVVAGTNRERGSSSTRNGSPRTKRCIAR